MSITSFKDIEPLIRQRECDFLAYYIGPYAYALAMARRIKTYTMEEYEAYIHKLVLCDSIEAEERCRRIEIGFN